MLIHMPLHKQDPTLKEAKKYNFQHKLLPQMAFIECHKRLSYHRQSQITEKQRNYFINQVL